MLYTGKLRYFVPRDDAMPRRVGASFATALLLAVATVLAHARPPRDPPEVLAIRRHAESVERRIEAVERGGDDRLYETQLVVNATDRPWPGSGTFRTTYWFYFEAGAEDPVPRRLLKVAVRTEAAARLYNSEYLFDGGGNLVFYFRHASDGAEPPETRVYFARGRPIRVVRGEKVSDALTPRDRELAAEAAMAERRIAAFFDASRQLPDQ